MSLISNHRPDSFFVTKPFGPSYSWNGDNDIIINEGELKNQIFFTEKNITEKTAELILYSQGKRIGHCAAEYEKNSLIEIWDVAVNENFQGKGLAEVMVKILFRELLSVQKKTKIKFRIITLYKPEEQEINLCNLGIGIIVYKLGMTCEYDLEQLIMQKHISKIECLPPTNNVPPSYKISLDVLPYTLIAVLMNEQTEKPINDYDVYLKIRSQLDVIISFTQQRQVICGNADYFLKEDMIDLFVSRLANNKTEAELFKDRIEPFK